MRWGKLLRKTKGVHICGAITHTDGGQVPRARLILRMILILIRNWIQLTKEIQPIVTATIWCVTISMTYGVCMVNNVLHNGYYATNQQLIVEKWPVANANDSHSHSQPPP